MALGPDELLEIDGVLSAPDADARVFRAVAQPVSPSVLDQMRRLGCDGIAVPHLFAVDVHLVDRSDHCVQITTDPARATGIVLADRS